MCVTSLDAVVCVLGLHTKSHAIIMRISSVKPVLWFVVNLYHLLADESPSIMNAILHSLSVIYGSVY